MLYPVKIEFKDYPSGSWQDWSEYLSEPPRISKKVESENEGEAGLIVFDDAEVSFRYESGSPVYSAFSTDLTSKQRYLFRISAPKTDKTFVQLFEGIADFSTLNWSEFNNVISFSLVDKLSALNLLQGEITRVLDTLNARVLTQYPDADGLEFRVDNNYLNEIWIKPAFGDTSSYTLNSFATPILFAGEILRDPIAMYLTIPSSLTYGLVTESWIEGGWNKIKYIKVDGFQYSAWYDETTYHRFPIWFSPNYIAEFGGKEIYGIDILNYNAGVPESINGLGLIEVLISKAWSGINFIYRGISAYNIPLSYYILFLDENPLGKTPLDALKMIADSMKCYIFFDRTGSNLIVQSKSSLATGGTTRSIGSTKIVSGPEKKYFWDKLVDGVTVNVKSWVLDDVTGENLIGVAELTKQPTGFSALQKIKPKNSIKRELLVGDPAIDTQEELNTYAAQEALSVLNFYGLRHSSFDINLNLDDNTINWELIDNLTISTFTTFITKMEIDLITRNISLEAVEITGHDYDFRQLVFGSAESSGSSIISSSSSGGGSYYSGITPIFNLPLQMSGGIVSLLITNNLKLTSDKLDTIQDIATTSTPTLAQLLLTNQATQTTHSVRADRTLQITTNAPLTGGGIAVDLTANRSWTLGINSANLLGTTNQINVANGTGVILGLTNVTLSLPQNIHTAATPTFNQLTLSSAGSGPSNAVRADRTLQISTNAPLTGGGVAVDLTANRSWTLGINSANLLGTTNRITVTNGKGVILGTSNVTLNLPQDIHTGASPTFAGLTINGNILQSTNAYIKNNFTAGWTGAGWQLDYGLTYSGDSYLEIDNLRVRGTMNIYELVINQIRATNGSLFVSSVAKVKTVVPSQLYELDITFEDPDNLGASPFALNDILLIQRVRLDATTVIKKLYLKVENISNGIVGVTYQGAQVGSVEVGDTVARIGNTLNTNRQGTVYLTSDDAASPYIDIYDGVTGYANWATAAVRKVRLGKLSGLTDSNFGALSGYGLYTTNAYLKGGIWATFGNIAGWTIESQKISKIYSHPVTGEANEVALNASSNDIGLHVWMDKDAINVPSMLSIGAIKDYTNTLSANEYGIQYQRGSDTYFRLTNSVQQIAGWNFNNLYLWKLTSGTPKSSPAGGIVMNSTGAITVYGNYWQKRVALYYSAANNWGLIGTNESYQTVFQLGYTNQIAGWVFDTTKLTSPSNYVQLVTDYTKIIAGSKAVLGNYASGLWGIKSENYQFVDSAQMLTLTSDSSTYWSDLRSETWTGVFASNNKIVNLVNEPFTSGTGGFTVNSYTGQSSIANMSGELAVTAYAISGGALADILISKGITTGIGGVVKPFSIKFDYHTYEYVLSGKVTSYGTYLVKIVENAYNGTVIKELYLDSTSDLRNMSVNFYSAASTIYIVVYVSGEFNVQLAGTNGYARLLLDNIKLYYWNAFNEISKDGIIFFNTESSYLQMGKDAFTFKGGAISCDSLTVNKINGYNACRFRGRSSTYPSSDMRPGDIYYNTSNGKVYIYNGNYWQALT